MTRTKSGQVGLLVITGIGRQQRQQLAEVLSVMLRSTVYLNVAMNQLLITVAKCIVQVATKSFTSQKILTGESMKESS